MLGTACLLMLRRIPNYVALIRFMTLGFRCHLLVQFGLALKAPSLLVLTRRLLEEVSYQPLEHQRPCSQRTPPQTFPHRGRSSMMLILQPSGNPFRRRR